MKRRMVLLILVLLLVLVFNSTALADSGDAPHTGTCVAYCARAGVFVDGVRMDLDGDGKFEPCLLETNCHKDEATDCGMLVHSPDNDPCFPTCLAIHGPGRPWMGH